MTRFMRSLGVLVALLLVASRCSAAPYVSDGLFGMSPTLQLMSIDVATGHQTAVGQPIPKDAQAQQLSAIDSRRGVYYIIGYNLTDHVPSVVGISLTTGKIVTDAKLPFKDEAFIGVGQTIEVDTEGDGHIVASGRFNTTGPHTVIIMDPKTGAYKNLTEIGDIDVLGSDSCYDPATRSVYIMLGVQTPQPAIFLFGIAVATGNVTEFTTGSMGTTNWDATMGRIVGLGYKPAPKPINYTRTLVSFDPQEKSFHELGTVSDFGIEDAGVAALSHTGVLYSQLVARSAPVKPPFTFHLVGVSLKTKKVVSSPIINPAPWSLEYYNAP